MNKDRVIFGIGISVLILVLSYSIYKQYDIAENKEKTKGEIIEFYHSSEARYGLKYRYWVDNKEYIGSTGVTVFKCDNGVKGCVGGNFTVYYSSHNPDNSTIDLEQYEQYKTTVEFYK